MARSVEAQWPMSWDAPSKRDRRGGTYRAYVPDPLHSRPWIFSEGIAELAAEVETQVRSLTHRQDAQALEGLARFLLRSEAIASSRIEGLQVSPQQVALAELAAADEESAVRGFSNTARLVANNVAALRLAVTDLVTMPELTADGVLALHRALLPDERHHGLRTVQNWVGGGDWHPLDAEFTPPPPAFVPGLIDDLVLYMNSATHGPLVQAALTHAQFETIHPFTDGNGRVGRALIHTVLTRRGLTRTAVLPISLVLLTRSDTYVAGLTSYRYVGSPDSPEALAGVEEWLRVFLTAARTATEQATRFVEELSELRDEWRQRHQAHRRSQGLRGAPRADSAVARLLDLLPAVPLVTARTLQRLLSISHPAARQALEELAAAQILSAKQVERGTTGYLARDVFNLLTITERRLASIRWDTRERPPRRPVPARPSHH
ncbi:Fic family protein [Thermopolyspora sp. NPDC052614]|uniref:Fic family protein n=1 Tax=Thermopolyspora sp. NPDC052614 TaxID=3155682 RepID=UPI0034439891